MPSEAIGRTGKGILNGLTGILGQFLSFIVSFIVRSIFIKTLGEAYVGLNGLYSDILSMLNLTELGIGTAMIIELYRTVAEKDDEKTLQYLQLYQKASYVIGAVILVLGLILTPFLDHLIKDRETIQLFNYKLAFLLYLFGTVMSYFVLPARNSIVTANQQEYRTRIYSYCFKILEMLLQIIALLLFKNLYVYIIIPIVVNLFSLIYIRGKLIPRWYPFINNKPQGRLSEEELRKTKRNVLSVTIYKLSGKVISSTDSIIISAYISIILTGIYSNYLIIVAAIQTLLEKVFTAFAAGLGNLNADKSNNPEKKYEVFKTLNFLNFWLYGYCAVCLFTMLHPFITVWIGEKYLLSELTEFVIVFNALVAGLQETVSTHRGAYGLFYAGRYRPVFSSLLNIVLSLFFVRVFPAEQGVIAVLLGTILSNLCVSWWFDAYILHKHAFQRSPAGYYAVYWLRMAYCIAMCLICRQLCGLIPFTHIWNLILRFFITTFIFHGTFLLLFRKTKEFQSVQDHARQLLKSRKSAAG